MKPGFPFSVLSSLSLEFSFGLYKLLKTKYIFKGYKFSRLSELYLIVCDSSRDVPIRVKILKGHIHRVKLELDPDFNDTQVKLTKNFVWDTLTVSWKKSSVTYYGDKISLPSSLVIPLLDKLRLKRLMQFPFETLLMVKQGKEWKRLDNDFFDNSSDHYFSSEDGFSHLHQKHDQERCHYFLVPFL